MSRPPCWTCDQRQSSAYADTCSTIGVLPSATNVPLRSAAERGCSQGSSRHARPVSCSNSLHARTVDRKIGGAISGRCAAAWKGSGSSCLNDGGPSDGACNAAIHERAVLLMYTYLRSCIVGSTVDLRMPHKRLAQGQAPSHSHEPSQAHRSCPPPGIHHSYPAVETETGSTPP